MIDVKPRAKLTGHSIVVGCTIIILLNLIADVLC